MWSLSTEPSARRTSSTRSASGISGSGVADAVRGVVPSSSESSNSMGDSTLLPRILSVKPVWPWPVLLCAPRERAIDARAMTLRANRGCEARRSRPQSRPRGGARCLLRCERCARCRIFPALAAPLSAAPLTAARFEALVQHHQRLDHRALSARSRGGVGGRWRAAGCPCRRSRRAPMPASPPKPSKEAAKSLECAACRVGAQELALAASLVNHCAENDAAALLSKLPAAVCEHAAATGLLALRGARALITRLRRSDGARPRRAPPTLRAARPLPRAWRARNCDGGLLPDRVGPRRCRPFSTPTRCRCRRRSAGVAARPPRAAAREARAVDGVALATRRPRCCSSLWHAPTRRSSSCSVRSASARGRAAALAVGGGERGANRRALARVAAALRALVGDGGATRSRRRARGGAPFRTGRETRRAAPARRTSPPFCSRTILLELLLDAITRRRCRARRRRPHSEVCITPLTPRERLARPRVYLFSPQPFATRAAAALALEARVCAAGPARMLAAELAEAEVAAAAVLLRRGADAAAADAAGVTPAHLAAEGGRSLRCSGCSTARAARRARRARRRAPRPAARRRRRRASRGARRSSAACRRTRAPRRRTTRRAGATRRPAPPPRCALHRRRRAPVERCGVDRVDASVALLEGFWRRYAAQGRPVFVGGATAGFGRGAACEPSFLAAYGGVRAADVRRQSPPASSRAYSAQAAEAAARASPPRARDPAELERLRLTSVAWPA